MERKEFVRYHFERRDPRSNKGDYGKVLIIGGSKRYPGAPLLAAYGASVSGVGYTALGITDDVYFSVVNRIPEVIYEPFGASFADRSIYAGLLKYQSIVFGNGIEDSDDTFKLLRYLLETYHGPLVIDATGLTVLKKLGVGMMKNTPSKLVLTPHLGEFGRLFDLDITGKTPSDFIDTLKSWTEEYKLVIDLKGAGSLVVGPDWSREIKGLLPGLAKAGSGDFLAGLIGGLLAFRKENPALTVALAHELMIMAAERLAANVSPHAFRASLLTLSLAAILKELE